MGRYDDMLDMPRPASRHASMSMQDRAAQFSSFAALTGYEQAVQTTAQTQQELLRQKEAGVPLDEGC